MGATICVNGRITGEDEAVLDEGQWTKQPDWTHDEPRPVQGPFALADRVRPAKR